MAAWRSSPTQSEPKALADMQNSSTPDCSSPSSIFTEIRSPGLMSHSSNHTRNPAARRPSASTRTTGLSALLWLRKTL
jgi:hypothetical protein